MLEDHACTSQKLHTKEDRGCAERGVAWTDDPGTLLAAHASACHTQLPRCPLRAVPTCFRNVFVVLVGRVRGVCSAALVGKIDAVLNNSNDDDDTVNRNTDDIEYEQAEIWSEEWQAQHLWPSPSEEQKQKQESRRR